MKCDIKNMVTDIVGITGTVEKLKSTDIVGITGAVEKLKLEETDFQFSPEN